MIRTSRADAWNTCLLGFVRYDELVDFSYQSTALKLQMHAGAKSPFFQAYLSRNEKHEKRVAKTTILQVTSAMLHEHDHS